MAISAGRAQSPKPSSTTHVGTAATDLVTLITEISPTAPGAVAPLALTLCADGGAAPFKLRKDTVLVVTDVSVTGTSRIASRGA